MCARCSVEEWGSHPASSHVLMPTQKIGTGFSDENLEQFAELFKDKVISNPRPYYRYSDQVVPDVWVQ